MGLSRRAEKLNRIQGEWRSTDIIDRSHAIYTDWLGKPRVRGEKMKGSEGGREHVDSC